MAITIRSPKPNDLAPLAELYNYYILHTTVTFDIRPYSLEERRQQWFEHYHPEGRHRLLVAELNHAIVGYVTSSRFSAKAAYDTSVETSIYIYPPAQGQGVGTRLYETLFEQLAKENVHRAYAGITLPNDNSVAFHKKMGFASAGRYSEVGYKFDQYWDVEWFEKAL